MTEVGVGKMVFVGRGGDVSVGWALGGFEPPPFALAAVGVKMGTKVPGVEVAVKVGVMVTAVAGVTGSSLQRPGPIIPRL